MTGMRSEFKYSVLADFDFSVLDDPDFREDSVREEIITPLLKALGYGVSGPAKIIRSKRLAHPYVSIGSASKRIHIVPDYLLEVEGRYAWTLEAKAPSEQIRNSKHVEQAYSYAIHSEIRVPYFALCNGREFVLYHISRIQPLIQFDLRALANYWDDLIALLGPQRVLEFSFSVKKDFGLHLKRLGFDSFDHLIFPNVPISYIAHLAADQYTISSGIEAEGEPYVVSFDFDSNVREQLDGRIPREAMRLLREPFAGIVRQIEFPDATYFVNVDGRVGEKLEENANEIYLPLWINRILS